MEVCIFQCRAVRWERVGVQRRLETVIHDSECSENGPLLRYVMYPNTGTVHEGPTFRECAAYVWTAILIDVSDVNGIAVGNS